MMADTEDLFSAACYVYGIFYGMLYGVVHSMAYDVAGHGTWYGP